MKYTLRAAAAATGKDKMTIQRAIKSGKISAEKKEDGSYVIEPSELHRVYPPVSRAGDATGEPRQYAPANSPPDAPPDTTLFERLLSEKDSRIRELQEERDRWREQADHWRKLLPAPRQEAEAAPTGNEHQAQTTLKPWWKLW